VGLGCHCIIKICPLAATCARAHALLPVLVLAAKSVVSFCKWLKTVCFWQRLKQLKTEKTFAGQGAY
jgi:hypothetical protein